MEPNDLSMKKTLAGLKLSLPSTGKISSLGYEWSKKGGQQVINVVNKVRTAARVAGWKSDDMSSAGVSTVANGAVYTSPEGHRLVAYFTAGELPGSNYGRITVTLAKPVSESKLTEALVRRIILEELMLHEMGLNPMDDEPSKVIGGVLMKNMKSIVQQLADSQMMRPVRIEDIEPMSEEAAKTCLGHLAPTVQAIIAKAYREMLS